MSASYIAGVPTAPFLDAQTRDISPAWRTFLISLFTRTGGGVGVSTRDVATALAAETQARIIGDEGPNHTYVYTQTAAAAVWAITHNLTVYPAVVVVDSSGTFIEGDIHYNNTNTVTLTFSAAFSGVAFLV